MPASSGLTPAEHAMLGLVLLGPRHGYEIAAHFGPEGDLGIVCQLPMSLLYAQLKRLESLGYLEGTTEFQANRPPRRVYRLTPEGEAEFWRWLDQPVARIREIRMTSCSSCSSPPACRRTTPTTSCGARSPSARTTWRCSRSGRRARRRIASPIW